MQKEIVTTQLVCPIDLDTECVQDTALILSLENDHTKIANILLQNGTDPNRVITNENETDERARNRFPLYEAVAQKCRRKTQMLLT